MILCCGEALIDMIPASLPDGLEAFIPHAGGAALNVAIAIGRLGAPAGLFTGLSHDMFGRQLAIAAQESKVDISLAVRSDRPTTLAFVELINGNARYVFHDENSAGRMLTEQDLPDLPQSVDTLVFGGISLIHAPAADTYAALARREAGRRCIVMDPNIRPGFVTDEAAYRARLMGMLKVADIVKISEDDLDWLLPETEDALTALLALGPALAVLTRGSEGALAMHRDKWHVEVPSRPTMVVDTVGAGDTFLAGMIVGAWESGLLSRNAVENITPNALREILSFAAAAAGVSVSRAGANPPWRHEL